MVQEALLLACRYLGELGHALSTAETTSQGRGRGEHQRAERSRGRKCDSAVLELGHEPSPSSRCSTEKELASHSSITACCRARGESATVREGRRHDKRAGLAQSSGSRSFWRRALPGGWVFAGIRAWCHSPCPAVQAMVHGQGRTGHKASSQPFSAIAGGVGRGWTGGVREGADELRDCVHETRREG